MEVKSQMDHKNWIVYTNLSTTGSILGSTSSQKLGCVLGGELVVKGEMLLLSENGVVFLQPISIKQFLIAVGSQPGLRRGNEEAGLTQWPGCLQEGAH